MPHLSLLQTVWRSFIKKMYGIEHLKGQIRSSFQHTWQKRWIPVLPNTVPSLHPFQTNPLLYLLFNSSPVPPYQILSWSSSSSFYLSFYLSIYLFIYLSINLSIKSFQLVLLVCNLVLFILSARNTTSTSILVLIYVSIYLSVFLLSPFYNSVQ